MPAFNYYQFISPKGEDLVLTQKVSPISSRFANTKN